MKLKASQLLLMRMEITSDPHKKQTLKTLADQVSSLGLTLLPPLNSSCPRRLLLPLLSLSFVKQLVLLASR